MQLHILTRTAVLLPAYRRRDQGQCSNQTSARRPLFSRLCYCNALVFLRDFLQPKDVRLQQHRLLLAQPATRLELAWQASLLPPAPWSVGPVIAVAARLEFGGPVTPRLICCAPLPY